MMKTKHILLWGITALVMSACKEGSGDQLLCGEPVTLWASQEAASGTRTQIQDGGTQVYWEPQDAIKVFFLGTGSRFVSQNTENTLVASFTGYFTGVVGAQEGEVSQNKIWGLYPYREDAVSDGISITTTLPAGQVGREGSFAPETHITLAQADGLDLAFFNVCGGIRFSLSQEGIRRVTFSGNQNEPLAGRIKMGFVEGLPVVQEVLGKETVLSLTAPDNGSFKTGVWYYLDALPCSLSKGFTMTLHKEHSFAERISSESVAIRRGVFGSLARADEGLVFQESTPEPQAIDLGLSVLWASCNLGAGAPEEYGNYYAWGETSPKTYYDWSTYQWCMGTNNTLTKYCFRSSSGYNGFTDTRTVLEPDDDAAHVNLGGAWRMPTREEWSQLSNSNNCNWTYITQNGVRGFLITSKRSGYEGNSIFLPAAGCCSGDSFPDSSSENGNYWSASSSGTNARDALQVDFKPGGINWTGGQARCLGFSVRPVCEKEMASISLNQTSAILLVGDELGLTASVYPDNAGNPSIIWSSDNPSVASVEDGRVKALQLGTAMITATLEDSGETANCRIEVVEIDAMVQASFAGVDISSGSMSFEGGFVKLTQGAKLSVILNNRSSQTITVTGLDLQCGKNDTVKLSCNINPTDLAAGKGIRYTITIPVVPFYSPFAVFTFEYAGKQYTVKTQYTGSL